MLCKNKCSGSWWKFTNLLRQIRKFFPNFLFCEFPSCCLYFVRNRPMDVHRGGQEGHLPPLAGQNIMFFGFFNDSGMFLGIFSQIDCFCPPLEKSLRTPMAIVNIFQKVNQYTKFPGFVYVKKIKLRNVENHCFKGTN